MYTKLNAINSASVCAVIGIVEFVITGWEKLNIFQKIIKALFIWVSLVELVFVIVIFILSMVGKIVNLIPLVNFVYCAVIYVIFIVAILIGTIASLYSIKNFFHHTNSSFAYGYRDALSSVGY